jgi:hypothetical protein
MAKRLLIQYRFWLDVMKPVEHGLAYQLDMMKTNKTRQFHKTIRDGLRLILDLRQGRVDVLFELFPDLQAHWKTQADKDMQERLARLESALLSYPTPPPALPSPAREREPERVEVEAVADGDVARQAANNFLSSFGGAFFD